MRIGTDIIEIKRIAKFIVSHGTICCGRVFTENEWEYCTKKQRREESFAACFAAKEAVAKAFGVGFGSQLDWLSVEVLHDKNGMPQIRLDAKGNLLMKNLGAKEVQISLSHCKEYAIALAVIS